VPAADSPDGSGATQQLANASPRVALEPRDLRSRAQAAPAKGARAVLQAGIGQV